MNALKRLLNTRFMRKAIITGLNNKIEPRDTINQLIGDHNYMCWEYPVKPTESEVK